jgi:DNA-directed RNA polymerase specialized sigma24 family protein
MKWPLHHRKGTKDEFREVFTASTDSLRWLCTTLTGDEGLTDKIVDAAFEQSLRGSDHVFREWMLSWARRLVINACAHIMRAALAREVEALYSMVPVRLRRIPETHQVLLDLSSEEVRERIGTLNALARFVVVLRAVEGYSRRDTALLLNIDDATCEWVYAREIAATESESHVVQMRVPNAAHDISFHLAQEATKAVI